jgi:cytochrome c oxidase subunit 5b
MPGIIILTAHHLLCLKSLCFCSVFHCSFIVQDAPAIVESHYDVRIVGCSGGVGEDEHDVTWFHLEKGKPYECPVCSQVFQLKVTGVGGQPGHDEHH